MSRYRSDSDSCSGLTSSISEQHFRERNSSDGIGANARRLSGRTRVYVRSKDVNDAHADRAEGSPMSAQLRRRVHKDTNCWKMDML
jgi:hypothetical protein